MHVLCGMPRSGSTLLANILNQNPVLTVGSTSVLCGMVRSVIDFWNKPPEVKTLLNIAPKKTQKAMADACRGLLAPFPTLIADIMKRDLNVFIDKGRGWNLYSQLFFDMFPNGKMIVCVRDPRDILASIIKQDAATPYLGSSPSIIEIIEHETAIEGMVGSCAFSVMDIVNRDPEGVAFVRYESFLSDPQMCIEKIYNLLGLEAFKHDFNDIVNTSYDADGSYLCKFPHKGDGKMRPYRKDYWKETISDELGEMILSKLPNYSMHFGYR